MESREKQISIFVDVILTVVGNKGFKKHLVTEVVYRYMYMWSKLHLSPSVHFT